MIRGDEQRELVAAMDTQITTCPFKAIIEPMKCISEQMGFMLRENPTKMIVEETKDTSRKRRAALILVDGNLILFLLRNWTFSCYVLATIGTHYF